MTTQGITNNAAPPKLIALAALWLMFGGAPNPSLFSNLSELLTDLANVLSMCYAWDPLSNPSHQSVHHALVPAQISVNFSQPL